MSRMLTVVRTWLPFAVVVTAFCGLTYVTVQQSLRQGANDPQIQMAEDAAAALDKGAASAQVVPEELVEFSTSLVPFLVVYDTGGKPVAGSGILDGKLPDYPLGALAAAKTSGENRVTWQPRPDVRIASVAVPYQDGYVVAGRSLREVESRMGQIGTMAMLAWIATLAAILAVIAFGEYALSKK